MSTNISPRRSRRHAVLCWALCGVVLAAALAEFWTGERLWTAHSVLFVAVAAVPALVRRDWQAVVPWPLLAGATGAAVARVAGVYAEVAGFLSIATFALLVVVELDVFTEVELSRGLAIAVGVMTTMAVEALWIVAQFYSDRWLDTRFLTTQTELQLDIVLVTVVGFVVGGLFYAYLEWAPDPDGGTSATEAVDAV